MTQLAAAKDLALLLGVPENDPRVELALRRASARFIGAVGWPVLRKVDDVLVVDGHGGRRLTLPAMNVTAAAVQIDGEPANVVTRATTNQDVVLNPRLGILHRAAGWPAGPANILVTYTHGWASDEIPGDIQDAVLEQAGHIAFTLGLASQESASGLSITYSAAATGGVTQRWADAVDRYRVTGDRT